MTIIQNVELQFSGISPPTYRKILILFTDAARVYMSSSRILFCVACFIIGDHLKSIGSQIEGKNHLKEGNVYLVENVQRQYTSGILKNRNVDNKNIDFYCCLYIHITFF